jgi:hypothetical protein
MPKDIHLLGLSVSDFHRDYRISQWESEAFSLSLSSWKISSGKLDSLSVGSSVPVYWYSQRRHR